MAPTPGTQPVEVTISTPVYILDAIQNASGHIGQLNRQYVDNIMAAIAKTPKPMPIYVQTTSVEYEIFIMRDWKVGVLWHNLSEIDSFTRPARHVLLLAGDEVDEEVTFDQVRQTSPSSLLHG